MSRAARTPTGGLLTQEMIPYSFSMAAYPHPFVRVKDTVNGIIVGFSSEADYTTYVGMMSRSGGNSHA